MSHRLQCDLCGAKSAAVDDPRLLTPRESQMLDEFRALHDATCASNDPINFPKGATSFELPAEVLAKVQVGPFGSKKPAPVSTRRPHGHFEYTGPYGERQEGETLSCCHCRRVWEVRHGSGKARGICYRCNAYTCGGLECDECIPYEQRLDNLEAGLPALTQSPPTVLVPSLVDVQMYGSQATTEQASNGDG